MAPRERNGGLLAARKRGRRLGRPPKLGAPQLAEIRRRRYAGETITRIARSLDVAPWTVTRALRRRLAG